MRVVVPLSKGWLSHAGSFERIERLKSCGWELEEAPAPLFETGVGQMLARQVSEEAMQEAGFEVAETLGTEGLIDVPSVRGLPVEEHPESQIAFVQPGSAADQRVLLSLAPLHGVGTDLTQIAFRDPSSEEKEDGRSVEEVHAMLAALAKGEGPEKEEPAGEEATSGSKNGSATEADGTAPAPAAKREQPSDHLAQLVAEGERLVAYPEGIWEKLPPGSELAADVIERVHSDRSEAMAHVGWILAADRQLLEAVTDEQRAELAAELVRARGGIAEHQVKLVEAETDLKNKQVELEDQRVELAKESVKYSREVNRQLGKWRALMGWGVGIVIFTTLASAVAAAYLIIDTPVDDAAIPAIIAALAVLAISPAVLLLRGSPLKGLDQWPGIGKAEEAGEPAKKDQKAAGSADAKDG